MLVNLGAAAWGRKGGAGGGVGPGRWVSGKAEGKSEEEKRGMKWRAGDLVVSFGGVGTVEGSCDVVWGERCGLKGGEKGKGE